MLKEIFCIKDTPYNLRNNVTFKRRKFCSTKFGSNTLPLLGPKIWESLPDSLRSLESLTISKSEIKKWIPVDCPCNLCKSYVVNLGYI